MKDLYLIILFLFIVTNLFSQEVKEISIDNSNAQNINLPTSNGNKFTIKNGSTFLAVVDEYGGALFKGTFGSGLIPIQGAGVRMLWYPNKAAFRAGYVSGSQWDDANIGNYSIAMGRSTTARGDYSIAMGSLTTASGYNSTSMGRNTTANGDYSTAMGISATASGDYSTAIGVFTTASGINSIAMGSSTTASGYRSTAMGSRVNITGDGSFFIGDNSSTVLARHADNYFYARFTAGYSLYTAADGLSGVYMNGNANSWSSISDSTKKENFKLVDGESFLNKISKFKLGSWNYIGQDPQKYRHYGPIAQDFYAAFGYDGIGTIGNDTLIASADFDGINFIAIQALEKRTREQEERIKYQDTRIKILEEQNSEVRNLNTELKEEIANMKNAFIANESRLNHLVNSMNNFFAEDKKNNVIISKK